MKYFSMFTGVGGFELGIKQAYENNKNRQQESKWEGNVGGSIQRQRNIPNIGCGRRKNGFIEEERCGLQQWVCVGFSEIDKYANQLLQIKFPETKNYGDATFINEHELPDFDLLVGGFPCQSFSIAGKRKGFADTRGTLFFDIARILAYKKPQYLVLENVRGLLSHDGGQTFQTIIRVLTDLGYFVEWQVLNSKNFGVPQNRERVFIVGHLGGQPGPKVFPIGVLFGKADKLQQKTDSKQKRIQSKSTIEAFNLTDPETWRNAQGRSRVRRLTPLETERLQGFPDNWTSDFSDTQRYKMMGNAVTVNVVSEIIKRLNL